MGKHTNLALLKADVKDALLERLPDLKNDVITLRSVMVTDGGKEAALSFLQAINEVYDELKAAKDAAGLAQETAETVQARKAAEAEAERKHLDTVQAQQKANVEANIANDKAAKEAAAKAAEADAAGKAKAIADEKALAAASEPPKLDEELLETAREEMKAAPESVLRRLYKKIGKLSAEERQALADEIAERKIDVNA